MIDQIRQDIQKRLDQVLSEADKLRHALTALGSQDGDRRSNGSSSSSPRPRARRSSATASRSASAPARRTRARRSTGKRAGSGATKSAVLAALSTSTAMTASEVAGKTGLGRASVSTTLSKLARSGEVSKADRGYKLPSKASA
jgi:hypothetical protein